MGESRAVPDQVQVAGHLRVVIHCVSTDAHSNGHDVVCQDGKTVGVKDGFNFVKQHKVERTTGAVLRQWNGQIVPSGIAVFAGLKGIQIDVVVFSNRKVVGIEVDAIGCVFRTFLIIAGHFVVAVDGREGAEARIRNGANVKIVSGRVSAAGRSIGNGSYIIADCLAEVPVSIGERVVYQSKTWQINGHVVSTKR